MPQIRFSRRFRSGALGLGLLGGMLGGLLGLAPGGGAFAAPVTPMEEQQLAEHVRRAKLAEQEGDPVKAFLLLRETLRLEQLWSANTRGEDSRVAREMRRFSIRLVRRDNDHLMRILHSRDVPLPDKLGLIRLLEEEVIMTYPGKETDVLLQGYGN